MRCLSPALLFLVAVAPSGGRILGAPPAVAKAVATPAARGNATVAHVNQHLTAEVHVAARRPAAPATHANATATRNKRNITAVAHVSAKSPDAPAAIANATAARKKRNATAEKHVVARGPAAPAAHANASLARKKRNLTAEEKVAGLRAGLEAIRKLRATMTAAFPPGKEGLQEMAQGALTTELQKKDSAVWSTLDAMLGAATQTMDVMKNTKSKAEKEKQLDVLASTINGKATVLKSVTDRTQREQTKHSEEYLLGLLMQHRNDWSMAKQLNVTRDFAADCPVARELLRSHPGRGPLAPQLAALMDAHSSGKAAKASATARAATTLLLQFTGSVQAM